MGILNRLFRRGGLAPGQTAGGQSASGEMTSMLKSVLDETNTSGRVFTEQPAQMVYTAKAGQFAGPGNQGSFQGRASPAIQVQTRGKGKRSSYTLPGTTGVGGTMHANQAGDWSGSGAAYQFESRTRGRAGVGASPGKKRATAHGLGGSDRLESGARRRYQDDGSRQRSNRSATSGGSPVADAVAADAGGKGGTITGRILDRSGTGGIGGAAATGVAALGMGAIGGGVSYLSGGEFGQGAVAGAMLGFGGRMAVRGGGEKWARGFAAEGGEKMTKKFGGDGAMGALGETLSNIGSGANVVQQRHAMLAGAGLGGFMFGGDRSRHNRGFNSSRGNRF